MSVDVIRSLPDLHARMLERVVAAVRSDDRFEALLGTGSLAYGGFDEHSDLDFFRDQVLGAMLQRSAGRRPRGLRRVEGIEGAKARLTPTLPGSDRPFIKEALKQSAALYVELRRAEPPPLPVEGMPDLLLDFIDGSGSRA